MSYLGKTPVDVVDALNVQSLTVDNNLTVDTDTLVVDSTNNRVGIGTSSPEHALSVFKDSSGNRTEIGIDNIDQRLVLGAYFESGVGQYSTIQSTNNAEATATNLTLQPDGGNVGIGTSMTIESNGNLQHLSKPAYFARAWVNFNGTGTVAIRANGNVSSITDYGTGYYGVNFSTAMIDANYAPVAMGKSTTSSYGQSFTTNTHQSHTQTTSQVRIVNSYQDDNSNGVTYVDSAYMFVAVYR